MHLERCKGQIVNHLYLTIWDKISWKYTSPPIPDHSLETEQERLTTEVQYLHCGYVSVIYCAVRLMLDCPVNITGEYLLLWVLQAPEQWFLTGVIFVFERMNTNRNTNTKYRLRQILSLDKNRPFIFDLWPVHCSGVSVS